VLTASGDHNSRFITISLTDRVDDVAPIGPGSADRALAAVLKYDTGQGYAKKVSVYSIMNNSDV